MPQPRPMDFNEALNGSGRERFAYSPDDVRRFTKQDDNASSASAAHVSGFADLLVELAGGEGKLSRPQALAWLTSHPRGRSLLLQLKRQQKETTTMSKTRTEELLSLAKEDGVVAVAKHVLAEGPVVSEHELTKMITATVERQKGESREQAFARVFSDASEEGALLRRAIAACRNFPAMAS
jgi:hypothetical protein